MSRKILMEIIIYIVNMIKWQADDFVALCGNQEPLASLSATCHPPPSDLIRAATDTSC